MTATVRMDRARQHAHALRQAIASVESADGRLSQASDRRAEVVAGQDALVAAAEQQRTAVIATAVELVGVDVAAELLDLAKVEIRRAVPSQREGGLTSRSVRGSNQTRAPEPSGPFRPATGAEKTLP